MVSDLGKVLLLPSFGGLPQWAVVGKWHVNFSFLMLSVFRYNRIEQLIPTLQETHFPLVVLLMNQTFTTRSYSKTKSIAAGFTLENTLNVLILR